MPSNSPSAHVVFLPWTRQGTAATIKAPDTLQAQPGSVTLAAELTVNGTLIPPVQVRVLGPSDVVGIGPHDIVRREPPPNTGAFEHNLFAAIEFDRPDFPWLFTPASAGANGRLRPWLCLIVVRKQAGVTLRPAINAPLPSIEIAAPAVPGDELPDLAESWLWAHSQVASDGSPTTDELSSILRGDTQLSLSRLLCPRLLAPDTEYIACLVPTFEAGRKAGLGLPVDSDAPLDPAWPTVSSAATTLPLYDHWTFRTGSGGDFKSLVSLLRAQQAPPGLGKRSVDISSPGFELPESFPDGATLQMEGALQPMDAGEALDWPEGTAGPFQSALAAIVNGPQTLPVADPLLAPPLYGRWHARRKSVKHTPPGITWFDELNLDPRHRSVAALGTRVVQEHQEALMASAWQQAGELRNANQRMRQMQLSLSVGQSLHARHIEPMQADALLRVAAPALGRIRAAASGQSATTLHASVIGSSLPIKAIAPTMRKLSRARGPASRRLKSVASINAGMTAFVAQLNIPAVTLVLPPPPGMAGFDVMRQRMNSLWILRYQQVTKQAVDAMPGAPQFQLMPEGVQIPMPIEEAEVPAMVDNAVASAFRAAARNHLDKLNPGRPVPAAPPLLAILDLLAVRAQLRLQMQPQGAMIAFAQALVPSGGNTQPDAPVPVSTIMHAPKFPQPMYEALRDLSHELLLPGLDSVLPNSALGLKTNSRFVNAYLVGLNFEMGRELLWRGYPTDQRGTYFDRFWDTADAAADAAPPPADIEPIHLWGERALEGSAATADGRFVMLLRSELLRRYPTASIYAVPATFGFGQRVPNLDPNVEVYPAFRGSLPPDVTFIGFDLTAQQVLGSATSPGYFIVIQEQPTEPRFGLDVGMVPTGCTHLPTVSGAPPGLPLRELQWRHNAAHMAGITRRLPVRILIHASQFAAPPASP